MPGPRRRRRACYLDILLSSLFLTLARLAYCSDVDIQTRDTIAAPISFHPAQNWEGIDGTWNSFTARVGTPAQTVRLQISTASQQTWVVAPRGCEGISDSNCPDERGGLFSSNQSTSYKSEGRFLLWTEQNLGYQGDGDYGFDVVALGGEGEGGPTLKNMTVGALGAEDFWFGHFGVNPKPTNFTSFNDPAPSYMTTLKESKMIPSVSFGYTAGAPYRFTKVLASLTLGGYDSSRFVPNDLSFDFASDNERDLVVGIQKISSVEDGQTNDSLLPNAVYAYIDSTVPQIWLPLEACQAFEKAFGLKYDNDTDLYLVDSDLHDSLKKSNPNVTFTLGQGLSGGPTVDIVLPYAAFDLQATPPYQGLIAQSYYFPLRRAANDTQYTLGRTFLQEAYLFVDWERETFNVSQCSWVQDAQEHIVAVRAANDTSGSGSTGGMSSGQTGNSGNGSSGIGTGAIAGIAAGIGVAAAALVIGLFFFCRRRRRNGRNRSQHEKLETPDPDLTSTQQSRRISNEIARVDTAPNVYPKVELDATQTPRDIDSSSTHKHPMSPSDGEPGSSTFLSGSSDPTSPGGSGMHEADSKPREVFEMMGDVPLRQEAGGRQLSEKESMMVREQRYNGRDIHTPTTPSGGPPPPFTPLDTGAAGMPRSDTAPSPLTPGSNAEARDYVSVRHPGRPPRRQINPNDVIELSPFERDNLAMGIVSPVSGPGGEGSSDGHGTLNLSPVGPSTGTMSSGGDATVVGDGHSPISERARRRFSYE